MKYSLEGYESKFEKAEETISQLDKSIEVIHSGEQKEGKMKKNKQNLWDLQDTIKCTSMYIMESQRQGREMKG